MRPLVDRRSLIGTIKTIIWPRSTITTSLRLAWKISPISHMTTIHLPMQTWWWTIVRTTITSKRRNNNNNNSNSYNRQLRCKVHNQVSKDSNSRPTITARQIMVRPQEVVKTISSCRVVYMRYMSREPSKNQQKTLMAKTRWRHFQRFSKSLTISWVSEQLLS